MSTGGKRAKSLAIPSATDEVFNTLGYFKRQTDDWGDAFCNRGPYLVLSSNHNKNSRYFHSNV